MKVNLSVASVHIRTFNNANAFVLGSSRDIDALLDWCESIMKERYEILVSTQEMIFLTFNSKSDLLLLKVSWS